MVKRNNLEEIQKKQMTMHDEDEVELKYFSTNIGIMAILGDYENIGEVTKANL